MRDPLISTAAVLAVLVALTAAAVWVQETGYERGRGDERAEWQAKAAAADRAQAEADRQARARNEAIVATYRAHLGAIAAGRDDFARRLRAALSRPAEPGACPAGAADPGPEPGGEGAGGGAVADDLAGAIADYDAACRADAAQLNALIRVVQP